MSIEAKPANWIDAWVWTPHFEGTHTSHDWQPYQVQVVGRERNSVVIYCRRPIEGKRRLPSGLYRIRTSAIKFEKPTNF